jgi:sterol desaturase/sphingolipid hydroxylase (fatty acid hydroxylase superfamily)
MADRGGMVKRGSVSVLILGVVQAAYLIFAIVYLRASGFPVLAEGRINPYLAYLAINVLTMPLATLLLPLAFTVVMRRQRIMARTGRMLREVWLSSLVLVPGAALLFKGFIEGRIGHLVRRLDRPLWFLFLEGVVFLVLADLWFYASHRALHSRLLYRFHKAHHAHLAPTEGMAFLALSPAEAYFSGLLTLSFPMLFFPVHAHVVIVCAAIILLSGFYIHEGALLGAPGLPLINGPAQHQMHHGRGRENANYALLFTVIDRMLGTYAAPPRSPTEAPGTPDEARRSPVIRP